LPKDWRAAGVEALLGYFSSSAMLERSVGGEYSVSIVALAAAALLQSAPPTSGHSLDLSSKLINNPAGEWVVYGPDQSSKLLPNAGPQGYPAYEVTVTKVGRNAWDDGAVTVIPKPINAGDVILIAVYLREPSLADG